MKPSMRRGLLVALLSGWAGVPAEAAASWDFFGGAGIGAGRSEDPVVVVTLRSVCDPTSAAYDPNDPICDPNSSSFDPFKTSKERTSELTGTIRLTGGMTSLWDRGQFDLTYSPYATYYHQRTGLNEVSHALNSSLRHSYTPRVALNVTEYFDYTPKQDRDPNSLQLNPLLTTGTSRTNSHLRATLSMETGPKTSISWTYGNVLRLYGSAIFIDTITHNAGMGWRRRVGRIHYINAAYDLGKYTFGRSAGGTGAAPSVRPSGSTSHQASVGYGLDTGNGLTLDVYTGYNVLRPDDKSVTVENLRPVCDPSSSVYDPNDPVCVPGDPAFDPILVTEVELANSSGLYANGTIGWSGQRLVATAGYTHSLADGGGAYANARAMYSYANLRYTFTPALSADMTTTRNVYTRVQAVGGAATTADDVRTLVGRFALSYAIGNIMAINGGYTYYYQDQSSGVASAPTYRSNRYLVGLTWSFD